MAGWLLGHSQQLWRQRWRAAFDAAGPGERTAYDEVLAAFREALNLWDVPITDDTLAAMEAALVLSYEVAVGAVRRQDLTASQFHAVRAVLNTQGARIAGLRESTAATPPLADLPPLGERPEAASDSNTTPTGDTHDEDGNAPHEGQAEGRPEGDAAAGAR